jgi:hypothetical protein
MSALSHGRNPSVGTYTNPNRQTQLLDFSQLAGNKRGAAPLIAKTSNVATWGLSPSLDTPSLLSLEPHSSASHESRVTTHESQLPAAPELGGGGGFYSSIVSSRIASNSHRISYLDFSTRQNSEPSDNKPASSYRPPRQAQHSAGHFCRRGCRCATLSGLDSRLRSRRCSS